jgi:tRNA modification GTPase
MINSLTDTIVALATAPGTGAIAVIRLSGTDAIEICNKVFPSKDLLGVPSHTVHFGTIRKEKEILDEALVSVFKAPHSYTKENTIEVSTHGSPYIINKIMQLFIESGARSAKAGEFTQRAFLNGQLDLAQAEAVADLIASDSEASHQAAMNQMRGGFSTKIKDLRDQLIGFASMIELELDFGEEDVEFADRSQLTNLIVELQKVIGSLISSFDQGNVIKEGIPTVIAGKPNAGKSTLLNTLFNEEKAIVTDIAGTTRDVIEDELTINGIKFRFIDTAGLREAKDAVEAIGIKKTREKMTEASLILYLFDVEITSVDELKLTALELDDLGKPYLLIGNKIDKVPNYQERFSSFKNMTFISAKTKINIEDLNDLLLDTVNLKDFKTGDTVVTNLRHFESLVNTQTALDKTLEGIDEEISGDFLAMDIRQALHHLGLIVGDITTDDLLESIFSNFCIGK